MAFTTLPHESCPLRVALYARISTLETSQDRHLRRYEYLQFRGRWIHCWPRY